MMVEIASSAFGLLATAESKAFLGSVIFLLQEFLNT